MLRRFRTSYSKFFNNTKKHLIAAKHAAAFRASIRLGGTTMMNAGGSEKRRRNEYEG